MTVISCRVVPESVVFAVFVLVSVANACSARADEQAMPINTALAIAHCVADVFIGCTHVYLVSATSKYLGDSGGQLRMSD
jgi:hypothetical protein